MLTLSGVVASRLLDGSPDTELALGTLLELSTLLEDRTLHTDQLSLEGELDLPPAREEHVWLAGSRRSTTSTGGSRQPLEVYLAVCGAGGRGGGCLTTGDLGTLSALADASPFSSDGTVDVSTDPVADESFGSLELLSGAGGGGEPR
jgi:hypothetical protein